MSRSMVPIIAHRTYFSSSLAGLTRGQIYFLLRAISFPSAFDPLDHLNMAVIKRKLMLGSRHTQAGPGHFQASLPYSIL